VRKTEKIKEKLRIQKERARIKENLRSRKVKIKLDN